jgi:hypothetical protein
METADDAVNPTIQAMNFVLIKLIASTDDLTRAKLGVELAIEMQAPDSDSPAYKALIQAYLALASA